MTWGRLGGWAGWAALVVGLPALAADSSIESSSGPVELRVVTYNTHGLPGWIARDRPAWRLPRIGQLLSSYDVALLQEDFAHHDLLRAAVSHDAILRGNDDSGLTTLSRWPPERVVDVERVPYGSCSGWLLGASDCLADKGFLRVRVALPNGAPLDLVNTHLEAGEGDADHAVRTRQLEVLTEGLKARAPGALVLGGDLNLDWDRPRDRGLLEGLLAALGLVDSGARPSHGSAWDRVDYLFLRGNEGVKLEVIGAGMAEEFVAEGEPLSDHPALFVKLRITNHGH